MAWVVATVTSILYYIQPSQSMKNGCKIMHTQYLMSLSSLQIVQVSVAHAVKSLHIEAIHLQQLKHFRESPVHLHLTDQ